ncbi:MAG TPA: hypothetical protein VNQ32_08225 [Steroidobacteraceae bacterium]|nr:hypothetical protein [Steroidobacteraceae bacterium]
MRDRPRVLILTAILGGHASAIYLLMTGVVAQRDNPRPEFLSYSIRLTPMLIPEIKVQPEGSDLESELRESSQPAELAIVLPEEDQVSTAVSLPTLDDEPEPWKRIDWASQAEQSTRAWSEPDSGPMKFGSTDEDEEPSDDPPRNIFEGNSPRRAGIVEMIEPGVERRWINSRCYREFGRKRDQVAGTRPDLNPVSCLIGSGPVRDDLFDHLKPDYLKGQE